MKVLVFKENFEGMSIQRNGTMETHIVDPSLLGTEMVEKVTSPDLVIVDKTLGYGDRVAALKYGHQVTGYCDANLQKVVLI